MLCKITQQNQGDWNTGRASAIQVIIGQYSLDVETHHTTPSFSPESTEYFFLKFSN